MEKPLKSNYCKLLLVLIIGIIAYLFFPSFKRDKIPWQMDWDYSYYLTGYKSVAGTESDDIVDALRIYKVTRKGYEWYGLEVLFKKELAFETRDKRYIREFVLAVEKWMDAGYYGAPFDASEGCRRTHSEEQESDKFYVVMFDNTFMRAGYFLMLACKSQDKEYLKILVPDASGFGPMVHYNESLVPLFNKLSLIAK
jgi:hypothetical protein